MIADLSKDKDLKAIAISSSVHKEIESRGRETSKDQGLRVTVISNSVLKAIEIRVEDHIIPETNKVQDLHRATETRVQNQNKPI
ncbi:hypothetical protein D3C87_1558790 [compost metagenome]